MTTDDVELAWTLAGVAHDCLSVGERHNIYIAIGVGETCAAIGALLTQIAGTQLALPSDVIATAATWLDGYVGHTDEPRLRELINRLENTQATTSGAGSCTATRAGGSYTCGLCGRACVCTFDPVGETWLCKGCHDEHCCQCHEQ
ncbi:hypothetical protein [Mycobacterium marseillense]|uniref:hypothetical protein n=1 Tax=Mycobacterium marseillense TaxID=701042 RepID=UPI0011A51B9A|nr:hypothetical protein [Mycobacterium marseillense]